MRTFIDLGAYVGDVTAYTLGLWGQEVEIHAFEPCPWFLPRLRERFKDCQNVHIHDVAVGMRNERLTLHIKNKMDATTVYQDMRDGGPTVAKVEVKAIDFVKWVTDNIEPANRENILLKMNIEGSEYIILHGLYDSGMIERIGWLSFLGHADNIPSVGVDAEYAAEILEKLNYGKEKHPEWVMRDMWRIGRND